MEEDRFETYYKLPKIMLEIMDWLCTTRFYKNTFKKRKEAWFEDVFEDVKENWKFCDFVVLVGTLEQPEVIKIGEIPDYQGEHEKSLVINFKNKENCYLVRGYATGLYASKIIQNIYPIPNYMKEQLYSFIERSKAYE